MLLRLRYLRLLRRGCCLRRIAQLYGLSNARFSPSGREQHWEIRDARSVVPGVSSHLGDQDEHPEQHGAILRGAVYQVKIPCSPGSAFKPRSAGGKCEMRHCLVRRLRRSERASELRLSRKPLAPHGLQSRAPLRAPRSASLLSCGKKLWRERERTFPERFSRTPKLPPSQRCSHIELPGGGCYDRRACRSRTRHPWRVPA